MGSMVQPSASGAAERFVLVVGLDFSEASDYALAVARNLARPLGSNADVHLVHVAAPVYLPAAGIDVIPALGPSVPDTVALTRKRLLDVCFGSGKDFMASVEPHVRFGDPAKEIAELARDLGAHLIVIGSHRRQGLSSALHRSLSARLAHRAPCSVLTALPREVPPEALVEPPCPDCLSVRRESAGAVMWCAQHSSHHVHGHLHHAASDPVAIGSWTFRA